MSLRFWTRRAQEGLPREKAFFYRRAFAINATVRASHATSDALSKCEQSSNTEIIVSCFTGYSSVQIARCNTMFPMSVPLVSAEQITNATPSELGLSVEGNLTYSGKPPMVLYATKTDLLDGVTRPNGLKISSLGTQTISIPRGRIGPLISEIKRLFVS